MKPKQLTVYDYSDGDHITVSLGNGGDSDFGMLTAISNETNHHVIVYLRSEDLHALGVRCIELAQHVEQANNAKRS